MNALIRKDKALAKAIEHIECEDWQGTCGCSRAWHGASNKLRQKQRKEPLATTPEAQKAQHEKHEDEMTQLRVQHCTCFRSHSELIDELRSALNAKPKG